MIKKSLILLFLLLPLTGMAGRVQAQQDSQKIVVICSGTSALYKSALDKFNLYLEKKRVSLPVCSFVVPLPTDDVTSFVNRVKKEKPDAILAIGGLAAIYSRKYHPKVPSVYCLVYDPDSLFVSGPGAILDIEARKQVQFVRKTFPHITRIGIIYTSDQNKLLINEFKTLIKNGDNKIILKEINDLTEFEATLKDLRRRADCLLTFANSKIYNMTTLPHMIKLLFKKRFPVIGFSASIVRAGALGGIYADAAENVRLAGASVMKILSDQAETLIYRPQKIRFGINKSIAKLLRIRINENKLKDADFVIEYTFKK